jgi:hypothetical protein
MDARLNMSLDELIKSKPRSGGQVRGGRDGKGGRKGRGGGNGSGNGSGGGGKPAVAKARGAWFM